MATQQAGALRVLLSTIQPGCFKAVRIYVGRMDAVDHTGLGQSRQSHPTASTGWTAPTHRLSVDSIDVIKNILRSTSTDRWALIATMLGTWLLPLDQAIYLGVIISLVGFLQRSRKLRSTPFCLILLDTSKPLKKRKEHPLSKYKHCSD